MADDLFSPSVLSRDALLWYVDSDRSDNRISRAVDRQFPPVGTVRFPHSVVGRTDGLGDSVQQFGRKAYIRDRIVGISALVLEPSSSDDRQGAFLGEFHCVGHRTCRSDMPAPGDAFFD